MKIISAIPKEPGNYQITLSDLVKCYESGDIQAYKYNRGMMHEKEQLVDNISCNFHLDSFGVIHIGLYEGKMTIADGHHRIYGVVNGVRLKKITKTESVVMIKVITKTEFLKCYSNLNNTLRHSTNQDVTNPDLRYGDVIINKIKPALVELGYNSESITSVFAGKRSSNLAYIIDALDRNMSNKQWCYTEIYKVRKSSAIRFHIPASESRIMLSKAKMDKLVLAVTYYLDYLEQLLTVAKEKGISLEGINTNASWFGLILTNLLSENCRLPRKPSTLVNKSIKSITKLNQWIKSIGGGSIASIASNEPDLWKHLSLNNFHKNWINSYECLRKSEALPKYKLKTSPVRLIEKSA